MKIRLLSVISGGCVFFVGGVFLYCTSPAEVVLPYEPEVTFAGYINGTYDSLTGNHLWRNTCRLIDDTIRIYCYSDLFGEVDRIRHGDLVRIDLYPDSGNGFEKRNVLFHMARYHDQNESYTVNIRDTVDVTTRFESEIITYSPTSGSELELSEIYVSSSPIGYGRYLEILRGHLLGRVHSE